MAGPARIRWNVRSADAGTFLHSFVWQVACWSVCVVQYTVVEFYRDSSAKLARSEISINPRSQIELWRISEFFFRQGLICLRPILREAIRILKIIGLKIGLQDAIKLGDDFVERPASPRAGVEDAAGFGLQRQKIRLDSIVDISEISLLLACRKNSRPLAGAHLDGQLMDHARQSPLVSFAGAVDVAAIAAR